VTPLALVAFFLAVINEPITANGILEIEKRIKVYPLDDILYPKSSKNIMSIRVRVPGDNNAIIKNDDFTLKFNRYKRTKKKRTPNNAPASTRGKPSHFELGFSSICS
jgi:hypothetical protein